MSRESGSGERVHPLEGERAVDAADRSARELDRFFALSRDMLCIAGLDGYFKRVNPAFEATLGYTAEELLSRPFLEFVHPDDRSATQVEMEIQAGGAPTLHFENRYRCKDGGYRWLSWRSSSPESEEQLVYAVARDVTSQKRFEQELREAKEAAEDRKSVV